MIDNDGALLLCMLLFAPNSFRWLTSTISGGRRQNAGDAKLDAPAGFGSPIGGGHGYEVKRSLKDSPTYRNLPSNSDFQ